MSELVNISSWESRDLLWTCQQSKRILNWSFTLKFNQTSDYSIWVEKDEIEPSCHCSLLYTENASMYKRVVGKTDIHDAILSLTNTRGPLECHQRRTMVWEQLQGCDYDKDNIQFFIPRFYRSTE